LPFNASTAAWIDFCSAASGVASAVWRLFRASTWVRKAAAAVLQALQSVVTFSRSTTATLAAGTAWALAAAGTRIEAASAAEARMVFIRIGFLR
jgi:hypothetical protein